MLRNTAHISVSAWHIVAHVAVAVSRPEALDPVNADI